MQPKRMLLIAAIVVGILAVWKLLPEWLTAGFHFNR
jgi:hypothetical protein